MSEHDLDAMFGALRALLESPTYGPEWVLEMRARCERADTLDPARFRDEWTPYLIDHSGAWPVPLATCEELEELELLARALPGARFDLQLTRRWIGTEGARDIARSPALARVRGLHIRFNDIKDAGVEALASAPSLSGVHGLFLGDNTLTHSGVRTLVNSEHLSGARVLDLCANSVGNAGALALAESTGLGALTTLYVCVDVIDDEGALALAQASNLGNLETLDLSYNALGLRGARALLESTELRALRDLGLEGCDLDAHSDELTELAASRGVDVRL